MSHVPLFRYLDTVGDGSGTKNFNENYAAGETALFIADESASLERMIVSIGDTTGITAQEYGNIPALTNGIEVKLYDEDDNLQIDLTDGVPILSNAMWGQLCYDVDVKQWGNGDELVVVRWTFAKSGVPLKLQAGWYLAVEIGIENLSGLLSHYFMIQGVS